MRGGIRRGKGDASSRNFVAVEIFRNCFELDERSNSSSIDISVLNKTGMNQPVVKGQRTREKGDASSKRGKLYRVTWNFPNWFELEEHLNSILEFGIILKRTNWLQCEGIRGES